MADNYTVLSQRQTTELDPSGRFADVMEVTYRTAGGTVGSVRIPLDRYTPEFVRQEIEQVVSKITEVENL